MKKTDTTKPTDEKILGENTVIELTVAWDTLKKAYNKALSARSGSVSLPGFRKGKAPTTLVEDAIGREKLYDAALQAVLPELYDEAVKKAGIVPLIAPQIGIEKADEGSDWLLKAETAVAPEVKLGEYQKTIKAALKKKGKEEGQADKKLDEKDQREDDLQRIYAALIESIAPKVAPILLQEEVNRQVQQLVSHLSQHHVTLAEYIQNKNQTEDEFRSEMTGISLAALQLEFILRAIALELKLSVTPEDYKEVLPEGGDVNRLPPDLRSQLESVFLRQKVSDRVIQIAHEN